MTQEEKEEVFSFLRDELQSFWAWLLEELGEEYFILDRENPSQGLEKSAEKKVLGRLNSGRACLWERDHYGFFDHPQHPSIYRFFAAEDVEILHYPEDFSCDHFRAIEFLPAAEDRPSIPEKKLEQSLGVLLASQALGWMYRLDLCDVCGLVEVWSMQYSPEEIALFAELP